MKHALFFACMCFAGAVFGQSICLETLQIDYGTIEKGTNGLCEFWFENTGQAPLVIYQYTSNCGCLVPDCPKAPIMPGSCDRIRGKYDTNPTGRFVKYLSISTNDPEREFIRSEIFGGVKDQSATVPTQEKSKYD